jgi:LPS O-antigen subunit length determinant protein (WzzB/FepE family)
LGVDLPLILIALGGIILAAGIILLSRFLKEYPLQES